MSFQKIQLETRGPVGVVRLNEPDKLNAVSAPMIEEVGLALEQLQLSTGAIVLCGAGRAFCSGAALDWNDQLSATDWDAGMFLQTHINPLMLRLRDLSVPLVCAVRGAAAGVGASLALCGDMVIASDSAYFLQAFSRIGLVPDGGATYLLARTIGRVRAMELMMLGDKLPATRALEWGLINKVVAEDRLETEAIELATRLAQGPRTALRFTRQAVWSALDAQWDQALQTERELQTVAGRTADFREGIAAFLAKRPAVFGDR